MPEDEIGRLTLRQFDALLERKTINDRRERLNTGIITAAIINSNGGHNGKAVSPLEFVPGLGKQEAGDVAGAPDLTTMTPNEQQNYLLAMFGKREIRR